MVIPMPKINATGNASHGRKAHGEHQKKLFSVNPWKYEIHEAHFLYPDLHQLLLVRSNPESCRAGIDRKMIRRNCE
jgi:hypothetical protein